MRHALEWMDVPSNSVQVIVWTILAIVAVTLAGKLLRSIYRARKARRILAEIRARHLTNTFAPQVEGDHTPVEVWRTPMERIGRDD